LTPANLTNLINLVEYERVSRVKFILLLLSVAVGGSLLLGLGLGLVLGLSGCSGREASQSPKGKEEDLAGRITISGAWALYPLVVRWGEEFQRLHPKVEFDISAGGAGKGVADVLGRLADLGMVSRAIHPEEEAKGALGIAVAKDAVFLTANERNPVLSDLLARGVKREALIDLWVHKRIKTWGELVGRPEVADPINLYTRSDACGAGQTWAEYLGHKQEDLKGIGVYGDPGLAQAVAADPLGLGYNNLNYAYDATTGRPAPGLVVLPLDFDGDGRVGPGEGPYSTKAEAIQAVAQGWVPAPPARDLYLVTLGKPSGLVREFLLWALSEGQRFVAEAGYIQLSPAQLEEQIRRIK
jgi:phosphate transport system substrate-binding protein